MNNLMVGIDDATKCPPIGSVFISGVVADRKTIRRWQRLDVKDSKLISKKKRFKLEEEIKERSLAHHINQITPRRIDDKIFNLNQWELVKVYEIAQQLFKIQPFKQLRIDNWEVNKDVFWRRVKQSKSKTFKSKLDKLEINIDYKIIEKIKFIPEHRSDENYTVVGAASILSKTGSDKQYKKYKQKYGDFGSGSPADPATREFVFKHKDNPPPIIRKSWKTYKDLKKLNSIEEDNIKSKNNHSSYPDESVVSDGRGKEI